MINVIIIMIIAVSAVWVYLDATKNKIGKTHGGKGLFNMAAGAWGVATLGLWIIAFPAYLIKRGALIEQAKENPVEVKARVFKAITLFIIGGVFALLSIGGTAPPSSFVLPNCDNIHAKNAVEKAINGMPIVKKLELKFVSLNDVLEQAFNQETQIRSCSALLVTTGGEDSLQYVIKWGDKDKGAFYIETTIQAK